MKYLAAVLLLLSCSAVSQPCRGFAVAWQDDLGNVITGFPHGVDNKFQGKLLKKFPGVCYDPQASTIFFVSSRPATYHGVRTDSQTESHDSPMTGTVQNAGGGDVGTINGTVETTTTTTTATPYTVDYKVLYLTVQREIGGKKIVIQSFSGKTLHPTMYGFCTRNCHPSAALIFEAVKWLSEN